MDDQVFNDIVADMDSAPVSAEATESPVEPSMPPTTDDASAADIEEYDHTNAGEVLIPQQAPPPDDPWTNPNNPYYQQMLAMQQQQEYEAQQQAAYIAQQQQYAYWEQQQQLDAYLREVSNGDVETYENLRGAVAAQVAPYQAQAAQMAADLDQANRMATAIHIAATAVLDPRQQQYLNAEIQRLANMPDPNLMVHDVNFRKAAFMRYEQEIQKAQQEIEQLRRQVGARSAVMDRNSRGADVVASGGAGSGPRTINDYDDFDAWFDDFASGRAS